MARAAPTSTHLWTPLQQNLRGTVLLTGGVLQQKLGPVAFAVWRQLIRWRQPNGMVWPTKKAFLRHLQLSEDQSCRALRRLRDLKVLRDLGYMEQAGCPKIWTYEILGDPADPTASAVWLPIEVVCAVQAAGTRGGYRARAGRPKSNRLPAKSNRPPDMYTSSSSTGLRPVSDESRVREGGPMQEEQLGRGEGLSLRAEYEHWRVTAENTELVPDAPHRQNVCAVRVPSPQLLAADAPEAVAARQLLSCYEGAVAKTFRQRIRAYPKGPVERTPVYKTLVAAVRALKEHSIVPAAWAIWSCEVWQRSPTGDGKRPPIQWVWNAKRIEEKRGWFRAEAGVADAIQLVLPDEAKELLGDWARFERLLWQAYRPGGLTESEVNALLGEALVTSGSRSRAVYAQRLERAQRAVADARARLVVAAQEGVWLW